MKQIRSAYCPINHVTLIMIHKHASGPLRNLYETQLQLPKANAAARTAAGWYDFCLISISGAACTAMVAALLRVGRCDQEELADWRDLLRRVCRFAMYFGKEALCGFGWSDLVLRHALSLYYRLFHALQSLHFMISGLCTR